MPNVLQSQQFIRFLFCGAAAALVNVASRYLFSFVVDYGVSIVLAYGMGMVTAFALFKIMIFQAKRSGFFFREAGWFVLVNGIALLQTLCVSIGLAEYIFPMIGFALYPATVAHVVGVGIPAVTSFWGHKYLTFKGSAHVARKLG